MKSPNAASFNLLAERRPTGWDNGPGHRGRARNFVKLGWNVIRVIIIGRVDLFQVRPPVEPFPDEQPPSRAANWLIRAAREPRKLSARAKSSLIYANGRGFSAGSIGFAYVSRSGSDASTVRLGETRAACEFRVADCSRAAKASCREKDPRRELISPNARAALSREQYTSLRARVAVCTNQSSMNRWTPVPRFLCATQAHATLRNYFWRH